MASLVVLDLECTGLTRPRVTELCMLSIQREELLNPGARPRVCNKLVLCVNPGKMIEPGASNITGLFNDALESQPMFDENTVTSISLFLSRLPQPICLLAHNGNNYDFKVLNSEMNRISKTLPGNIYCADSLEALRALDSEDADESSLISSTSSNSETTSTPSGQNIPEIPKDVFDIKSRVRQIKRKCDPDFDRPPIQAKSVRKRLFDSAGKKDREETVDPLDLTGHKPMGSSLKMSADVVSKRNTCDVESVKKRLTFDDDEDVEEEEEEEDIEMSASEEDPNQCQANISKSNGTIPESQGSLPDVDFLLAVEHLEHSTSKSAKESETKTHCATPQSTARISGCSTPKEQTVNVLSNCEGLCTPETPSTMSTCGQNMSSANMVSPVREFFGNPRKDECVSLQASPVQRGQSPPTEKCLTPMTGLVRSTAAFQLGTPVKNLNKNSDSQPQKEVVPNGVACRSLFRQRADVRSAGHGPNGHRPRAPPLSLYPNRISYKLGEVYRRMFGQEPDDLHSAESDCVTLMRVVKHRSPEFIQWVDEHAVLLSATGLY